MLKNVLIGKNDIYSMSYINFTDEHHVAGNSIKLPVELMKKFYILNSFYLSFPEKLSEDQGVSGSDVKSCKNEVNFLTFDQLREGKYNYFSKFYCRKANWNESARKC